MQKAAQAARKFGASPIRGSRAARLAKWCLSHGTAADFLELGIGDERPRQPGMLADDFGRGDRAAERTRHDLEVVVAIEQFAQPGAHGAGLGLAELGQRTVAPSLDAALDVVLGLAVPQEVNHCPPAGLAEPRSSAKSSSSRCGDRAVARGHQVTDHLGPLGFELNPAGVDSSMREGILDLTVALPHLVEEFAVGEDVELVRLIASTTALAGLERVDRAAHRVPPVLEELRRAFLLDVLGIVLGQRHQRGAGGAGEQARDADALLASCMRRLSEYPRTAYLAVE